MILTWFDKSVTKPYSKPEEMHGLLLIMFRGQAAHGTDPSMQAYILLLFLSDCYWY